MIKRVSPFRLASFLLLTLPALACGGEGGEGGGEALPDNPLLFPRAPEMNMEAPASYRARFETSKGDFVVEVHRDWTPGGADRFPQSDLFGAFGD